jgi:hypothetical protein
VDTAVIPIIIIPLALATQFFLASRCDWRWPVPCIDARRRAGQRGHDGACRPMTPGEPGEGHARYGIGIMRLS